MDYVTWHFKCPKCHRRFDMREHDWNKIPETLDEQITCPGMGDRDLHGNICGECGHVFNVNKSMLYSNSHRSWPQMEAFVEGLIRGDG